MKKIILLIAVFAAANIIFAQSITNINPAQRTDGSKIVDVYYDLSGPEPAYSITIDVSLDGGTSFMVATGVTGDAGPGIAPGTGKHIIWDFGTQFPNQFSDQAQIKVTASLVLPWSCGLSLSVTHTTGNVAPVDKTVDYGTVETNLTGSNKCWITRNLGASQQATSGTDNTEASAGWYWQFNRKQGYKHDGTTRTPNTPWITSINESSDWLIANDPCALLLGTGWRLPTFTEWYNADMNGGWNNYNYTYDCVLKLHAAGYLYHSNGALNERGSYGLYWSSTQYSSTHGWDLYFDNTESYMNYHYRAFGFSSRCLRD